MRKLLLAILLAAAAGLALWAMQPKEPPLASTGPTLTARLVKQWDNGESPARQAAFRRDGKLLATSNAAGDVKVMRTANWRVVRELKVPGGATSLTFTLDSAQLTTAGYDGIVRSWNLSDGQLTRRYPGATGPVW